MSESVHVDRCVRAMTNDGGFRLVAVTLEDTVAKAAAAQQIGPPNSEKLAELMVGAVLLRETTSPGRRVQVALRDRAGGRLVADSLSDGLTRGLVRPGDNHESESPWSRSMEVTYTQINGALHKGIVAIEDETDISAAMMTYLQESEQILTTISVAASSPTDAATVAAGFVVQLLPELERSQLSEMTERLAALESLSSQIATGLPPVSGLIDLIFEGFEYTILADSEIRFGCNCSRERFLAGIGTLAPEEIQSMIADKKPLELRCDACGKSYEITTEELEQL